MAVIGFTRTLAADVGRYNITVNAICPGGHEERSLELARGRAEYAEEAFDEEAFRLSFRATQDNNVIAGRWCADEGYTNRAGGPEDAATIALFLASDEAGNFTGKDINSGCWLSW